jgi:hypothetical protein
MPRCADEEETQEGAEESLAIRRGSQTLLTVGARPPSLVTAHAMTTSSQRRGSVEPSSANATSSSTVEK